MSCLSRSGLELPTSTGARPGVLLERALLLALLLLRPAPVIAADGAECPPGQLVWCGGVPPTVAPAMGLPAAVGAELSPLPPSNGTSIYDPSIHAQSRLPGLGHGWLWIFLLIIGAVHILAWSCHFRYNRRQEEVERHSKTLTAAEEFSVGLVAKLMPDIEVNTYRFRGMRPITDQINFEFRELGFEVPLGLSCSSVLPERGSSSPGSGVGKRGKTLLEGVTGRFTAGTIAAIMGPSGAGKTTFLKVLCGKEGGNGQRFGEVRINGEERDVHDFKDILGYVPQEDVVHARLTVREQIYYSAVLRNLRRRRGQASGCGCTAGSRHAQKIACIVEDVLTVMQLKNCQNLIVGDVANRGVSGGQRKRVNIGLELAALPTVIFLDEPTSGLDATCALGIVNSLKKMTELGMTVIMVIHQPRYQLFTLFDEVLLLGMGGRTVFLGPSGQAAPYFESLGFSMPQNENPADWIMDVLFGQVENPLDPSWHNEVFFERWKQHVTERSAQSSPLFGTRDLAGGESSRAINDGEACGILLHFVREAWGTGSRGEKELPDVFLQLTGTRPEESVCQELWKRMAGTSKDSITEGEFVHFVLGLRSLIAKDQVAARATPASPPPRRLKTIASVDSQDESSGESGGESFGESFGSSSSSSSQDQSRQKRLRRPGCLAQFHILFQRGLVDWLRMYRQRSITGFLMVFAATVFGLVAKGTVDGETVVMAPMLFNSHLAITILMGINALCVFGSDLLVFQRETARGLNVLAYFCGKVLTQLFDVFVMSFTYTAVWYIVTGPPMPFWIFWTPLWMIAYHGMAMGLLISTVVGEGSSTLAVCTLVFSVAMGLGSDPTTIPSLPTKDGFTVLLSRLSCFSWSMAMVYQDIDDYHLSATSVSHQTMQPWLSGYGRVMDIGLNAQVAPRLMLFVLWLAVMIMSYLGLRFAARTQVL